MNALFIRIYGLVILAMVAVITGVALFGVFSVLPDRNDSLSTTVAPGLRSIVARIERGEEPEQVFAEWAPDTGPTLAMVPMLVLDLSAEDQDALKSGSVIVAGSELGRAAYAYSPRLDQAIELELLGIQTTALQWATPVLRRALTEDGPPTAPVTVSSVDHLSPYHQAVLEWRPVAVSDGWWSNASRVYAKDPATGRVLSLQMTSDGPGDLRWFFLGGSLLFTAIAVLVPLVPLRRRLIALGDATERLKGGDLDARVQLSGRPGPVQEVSVQFNAMADQIQGLVGAHESLLQSVSHELRTPIARLLFSIELLDSETDPARATELRDQMRDTVLEARTLTAELLTFTRLGEGAPDLAREPVDLTELVDDAAARWDGTTVSRPNTEILVDGDPRLLFRAIDNVVANAVRYANPPTVTLTTSDDLVQLWVDDDGEGIPEAVREQVFDPFVRLEASRSKDTGGTGLGLAIVRRIALRHGGTCHVETSPAGGARLVLTLPLASEAP
ncbi:MAG: ATP-binding protein [Myxococcota bacterium]